MVLKPGHIQIKDTTIFSDSFGLASMNRYGEGSKEKNNGRFRTCSDGYKILYNRWLYCLEPKYE